MPSARSKSSEAVTRAELDALLASLSSDGEVIEPDLALFRAAGPDSVASPPQAADETARRVDVEAYDFRRPDKLSKDQLRTLQMLHETFSRQFASSLSAYLRVTAHVDLVSVEQAPYADYMRSLTSSVISVFSMHPLAGQAVLELEFGIVLTMLDRLLGGPGNMVKSSLILTEIERALTVSIIQRALSDLRSAWASVAQVSPRRESTDTQAELVEIVPPDDTVVGILFEMKVGDARGAMSLCIPYTLLKPVAPKLSVQRWLSHSAEHRLGQNADSLAAQVAETSVTCVCRLGTAVVSLDEVLALQVGDTIVLDRCSADEVDLVVGGKVKFRGKPGAAGKRVAVHINRAATEARPAE